MNVEEWPIERLTPYENNPRDNDGAVDAVRASIEEFGWQQPIVVDGSGTIIVGHTRYKAALAMYGSEFAISNFEIVSKLDDGTAIFGKGALISDAKAEKAKAEKAKVKVTLSEREIAIVRRLNAMEAGE